MVNEMKQLYFQTISTDNVSDKKKQYLALSPFISILPFVTMRETRLSEIQYKQHEQCVLYHWVNMLIWKAGQGKGRSSSKRALQGTQC